MNLSKIIQVVSEDLRIQMEEALPGQNDLIFLKDFI